MTARSWIPTFAMRKLITLLLISASLSLQNIPSYASSKSIEFQAEVWADNWFALYVNGKKVGEDSVKFNTERSFNSSLIKFTATYPFEVGFIARDFIENESGLEYIGKSNQQIGDAGIIFQIREVNSKRIVSTSSSNWKSLIIQKAPLNVECVKSSSPLTDCRNLTIAIPTGWSTKVFKDGTWKNSTEFTPEEVGVKEGYFDYQWDPSAKLIWSSDLKLDNTVLLRNLITFNSKIESTSAQVPMKISSQSIFSNGQLDPKITCDGGGSQPTMSWSGVPSSAKSLAVIMNSIPGPPRPGEVAVASHAYLVIYNIPTNVSTETSGNYRGSIGLNFKDKTPGYTSPCSQGPGAKRYTITLYALSSTIDLKPEQASEELVAKSIAPILISSTSIDGYYTRS
jgi:phosphatidylethanolamine-binding protein (PEBP) family uncharacterized protein